jgi:hypothetical protein
VKGIFEGSRQLGVITALPVSRAQRFLGDDRALNDGYTFVGFYHGDLRIQQIDGHTLKKYHTRWRGATRFDSAIFRMSIDPLIYPLSVSGLHSQALVAIWV